jgi:hypothetical protein
MHPTLVFTLFNTSWFYINVNGRVLPVNGLIFLGSSGFDDYMTAWIDYMIGSCYILNK